MDRATIVPHWARYRAAVTVLTAGLGASCFLFLTLREWEHREEQAAVRAAAAQRVELLRETLGNSLETLHALGSFFSASGPIDRARFGRFAADALARRPEVQGLSWTPRVPAPARNQYEATARAEGFANFEFTEPDPRTGKMDRARNQKDFYYPVYYIEPFAKNRPAFGYDLNGRLETLARARDSGKATATPPVYLMQEKDHELGFVVYLPLYVDGLPADAKTRLRDNSGFVAIVFRIADLAGPALARQPGLKVTLRDTDNPDSSTIYAPPTTDAAPAAESLSPCTLTLPFASREWRIQFTPTTSFVAGYSAWQSWAVLCGSLALTGMLTSYLLLSLRRNAEIARANTALQHEISVRKRAEDAAASASRAKSDFLASLSHEIRTPLNSILGYTQILERDATLPHRHRNAVLALTNSGHHLLGLLNSILDLSKIEAGRMELQRDVMDVRALVYGLAQMFKPRCAEKHLVLRVECGSDRPYSVIGDEGKLRQVLINLLGNAIKFTPRGEVYLGAKPPIKEGDEWLFEVIDTGVGLTLVEQKGLGLPFHQTAAGRRLGGTGLGLAIARGHVELMGGRLEFTSEPGLGTRSYFSLQLPEAVLAPSTLLHRVLPRLSSGVQVRALVVDDHHDNRIILTRLLAQLGCVVAEAGTPERTRDIVQQVPPDILFLDVLLGETSGPDLLATLRADGLPDKTTIVFHTAALLAQEDRDVLRAGGAELLAKPFRLEDLWACLQRVPGAAFDVPVPVATGEEAPSAAEIENIILPQDLYSRISVAAELHSTTVLKACLEELRGLGGPSVAIADHLRHLLRSYDHAAIARLLSKLQMATTVSGS